MERHDQPGDFQNAQHQQPVQEAAPLHRERMRSLRLLRERLKVYRRRATTESIAVRATPLTADEQEAEQLSSAATMTSPPLSPSPARFPLDGAAQLTSSQSDTDVYAEDDEAQSDGSGDLSIQEESRNHLDQPLPAGVRHTADQVHQRQESLHRQRMSDPQFVGEITVQELEEILAAVTDVTEFVGDSRAPSSTQALIDTMKHVRDSTLRINHARLEWEHPVKSVLVVKKRGDSSVTRCFKEVVTYLSKIVPGIKIFFQPSLFKEDLEQLTKDVSFRAVLQKMHTWKRTEESPNLARTKALDLVVSLGGDGTLLHIASMFQAEVPPVLCFAMGSLGFLTLFDIRDYKTILKDVLRGGQVVTVRMRLQCQVVTPADGPGQAAMASAAEAGEEQVQSPLTPMPPLRPNDVVHAVDGPYRLAQPVPLPSSMSEFSYAEDKLTNTYHLLNELVIDRGPCPYLTNLEVYVDGLLVTCVQGDGLIVATPTGSTAYSVGIGRGSVLTEGGDAVWLEAVVDAPPRLCVAFSCDAVVLPDRMRLPNSNLLCPTGCRRRQHGASISGMYPPHPNLSSFLELPSHYRSIVLGNPGMSRMERAGRRTWKSAARRFPFLFSQPHCFLMTSPAGLCIFFTRRSPFQTTREIRRFCPLTVATDKSCIAAAALLSPARLGR
jgi:NAD kinase